MIKAVVFDLGEVLASPPSLLPTLAQRMGTTADRLAEHYWNGRPAYDAGAAPEQYWGPVVAEAGGHPDEELTADLARMDAALWSEIRPTAWQLLRDCRNAGVVVAVLSNAPHAMQGAADASPWRSDLDHLFVSATMGLVKPDPMIHTTVSDELGLAGPQIAFIDDKQLNVDGALSVGWQAHLWVDDADTRAWLEELGVLH